MAWAAFLLFFGGLLWRLIQMLVRVYRGERFIVSYLSLKYSIRSIFHWAVPYASHNWRQRPVFTLITFAFHICLIAVPLFLSAHIILLDEAWNVQWCVLPNMVADALSIVIIGACVFFGVRRWVRPEVRFVTEVSDYLLLVMVAAPFVTGVLAYHQWGDVQWMTLAHMVTAEILLAAVPFTRLSHMLFAPFTRAYMGSEFGGVRNARDW
jgi:nitrate reductase gamma subunit